MADFLDTLKVLGVGLKDAALETANNTAVNAVKQAGQAITNSVNKAGNPTTISQGTIKQPTTGTNADGTTIVAGAQTASNPVAGIPAWALYGGGAVLVVVAVVVLVKVVK